MIRDTRLLDSGMVGDLPIYLIRSNMLKLLVMLGIAKMFASSKTLKTEVVENEKDRIIFKLQQEYTPKLVHLSKPVNSLITLTLDEQGKVKYHKDMWNDKDYSHEGLGKIMKTLNGDHLTKVCLA